MSHEEEVVAIAVVTYNSSSLIRELVASLEVGLRGVAWRLLLVDNDSSDGTASIVREYCPDATVIEMGRNAGYAAAINQAVALAGDHTAVLVLNPDVRLQDGCVARLLTDMRARRAGIVVPRLVDSRGGVLASLRRRPTLLRAVGDLVLGASRAGRWPLVGEIVTDKRVYQDARTVEWAEGAAQLISRECWEDCGPWDEGFFLYSEETEYDLRAGDHGWMIWFVPEAQAVHLRGSSRTAPGLWALLNINRVRLFRRRHGLVLTSVFWFVVLARETSRGVLGRRTSQAATRALLSPSSMTRPPGPWVVARYGDREFT